jgi:hypothetical protein
MTREDMVSALRTAIAGVPASPEILRRIDALPTDGTWSAEHITLAEAHYYQGIIVALDELAPAARDPFDKELAKVRAYQAFLPKQATFERTDGKGSSHVALVKPCPSCSRGGVHYEGSEVLEGSLEWNHVVHTEVNDHFKCVACGWEWHERRFL